MVQMLVQPLFLCCLTLTFVSLVHKRPAVVLLSVIIVLCVNHSRCNLHLTISLQPWKAVSFYIFLHYNFVSHIFIYLALFPTTLLDLTVYNDKKKKWKKKPDLQNLFFLAWAFWYTLLPDVRDCGIGKSKYRSQNLI